MNKKEFILYLMEEYKGALLAIEAEEEWERQEDERVEKLREERGEEKTAWIRRNWYSGRHVSKAELNRIRLMLHKAMLEVEESEAE